VRRNSCGGEWIKNEERGSETCLAGKKLKKATENFRKSLTMRITLQRMMKEFRILLVHGRKAHSLYWNGINNRKMVFCIAMLCCLYQSQKELPLFEASLLRNRKCFAHGAL
jgi:hypothetical protein